MRHVVVPCASNLPVASVTRPSAVPTRRPQFRTLPSALIPPVIIVLIAIVVGFVVYSILSAVFEMTHSLQFHPG